MWVISLDALKFLTCINIYKAFGDIEVQGNTNSLNERYTLDEYNL